MNESSERVPWWKNAVIYQIYPRSYQDSDGDGIGDLAGITSRLDYIEWLGVDVIWLSPIYTSPMADFGYDVADYRNVDPIFGTLDDFDVLLESVHSRGMKLLMDFVPNHTSNQHEWFKEARTSRDSRYRDWYIWRDPRPDGAPPNNWMSYFGGPAWTLDEASGQYYLHNFAPEQPELNWLNPDVEAAMHDQMRFWLDRGIDGFRIDVIDRLIKDRELRDNPLNPEWREGDDPSVRVLRVHSEQQPEVVDIVRRMRRMFDEYEGDRVMVGEIAYDAPLERLVQYYGTPPYDGAMPDGMHLPFNFRLLEVAWDAAAVKGHIDAYESICPPYAVPNYVLGNHDRARMAATIGPKQARVAAMLLLTLRGVPTLYYGDEIGMDKVTMPPDHIQDPMGRGTAVFNRDESRSPMQWDATANAGFCPADVEPWLPVSEAFEQINVEREKSESQSILNLYKRLLVLRRETSALRNGTCEALEGPEGVFAFIRRGADEAVLVALNFTSQGATPFALDEAVKGNMKRDATVLLSTVELNLGDKVDLSRIELAGDEGVVVRLLR